MQIVANVSASVGGVMQPAGFENSQGILSASYLKDGADPQWDKDPGMEKFLAFLKKDYPEANKLDGATSYGYAAAQTMVKVLEMCGDDLTRANVLKHATTLAGFHSLNYGMFDLAYGYAREQMKAYVELQEREFAAEARGYTATKHQREVGAGYFDRIATTVDPNSSTTALSGSTEEGQFH